MSDKLEDFVQLPRRIRDDYINGKLTRNEFDVLVWIWINANPFNGFYQLSYRSLMADFRETITNDNARKIISSLRKSQHIYFVNHNGRGGSFPVYPAGFRLTNGKIQDWKYLQNRNSITTETPTESQLTIIPQHNLVSPNHNFQDQKKAFIEGFSIDSPKKQITTPYNDNYTKNNNLIIDRKNKLLKESIHRLAYKLTYKEAIPVNRFIPKTWEEEQCQNIAKKLGETDMRFLLSCLNKYGFNHLERSWGIFRNISQEKVGNKPKYFNKLIRNLSENKFH